MLKQLILLTNTIFLSFIFGCTSNEQVLRHAKNECYSDSLKNLQNEPVYNEVMSQFVDTFKIMKSDKRYFGAPPGFDNKVDEAIFFNKNKTECLLVVLQKSIYDLVFGQARMIRGVLQGKKWVFKLSTEYIFFVATGSSTNLQKRKLSARGLHSDGKVLSVTPRC